MPVTSWNVAKYRAKVEARVKRNLDRAAIFLVKQVKDSFGSAPKAPDDFERFDARKAAKQMRRKQKEFRRVNRRNQRQDWKDLVYEAMSKGF